MTYLNFSKALDQMKAGHRVTRKTWESRGLWVAIQRPDVMSKMTEPYIFMKRLDNSMVPWTPTQSDILAEDWRVVS